MVSIFTVCFDQCILCFKLFWGILVFIFLVDLGFFGVVNYHSLNRCRFYFDIVSMKIHNILSFDSVHFLLVSNGTFYLQCKSQLYIFKYNIHTYYIFIKVILLYQIKQFYHIDKIQDCVQCQLSCTLCIPILATRNTFAI